MRECFETEARGVEEISRAVRGPAEGLPDLGPGCFPFPRANRGTSRTTQRPRLNPGLRMHKKMCASRSGSGWAQRAEEPRPRQPDLLKEMCRRSCRDLWA